MATVFLVLVVVLVVGALVFGVVTLLSGEDPGISAVEPDGRAQPLPNNRSLTEADLKEVRFDMTLRGYRMAQVDRVLRRTAYDLGYKDEMIAVLEAEVTALRDGRLEDAELLRKARESAANPSPVRETEVPVRGPEPAVVDEPQPPQASEAAVGAAEPAEPEQEPREGSLRRPAALPAPEPLPTVVASEEEPAERSAHA